MMKSGLNKLSEIRLDTTVTGILNQEFTAASLLNTSSAKPVPTLE